MRVIMRNALKILALGLFLFLLGCPGRKGKNACSEIDCERGICDEDAAECVNAARCADEAQCLQGYRCFEGECTADYPCGSEQECDRGICVSGACVNRASCVEDPDCVAGYRCDSGECVVDECADVDCPRGVCSPSTATCVNSDVCTRETQTDACLDDYFCYGQKCVLGDEICDDVDCARGVCDPAIQECVEPANCMGEDTNCLAGNYCDEQGECAPNQCDENMQDCPRGVCNPGSGTCENATDCAAADECLDGFSCVDGTCVTAGEECGTCPGNQVCVYVPSELQGVCDENPDGCRNALDCADDRVCTAGACGQGEPCTADAFEPNDDQADAVPIAEQNRNTASGSICAGDVDVFAFHTDDSELFRGTLVVDVRIDPIDVGAGQLSLELVDPDGNTTSADSDASGVLRLTHEISVLTLGQYYIRISDAGDVPDSGIDYSVFADMFDDSTIDACQAAEELGENAITGNSNSGDSYLLDTECTIQDNQAGENIYRFTLDEPRWVTLTVVPATGVDISASIRTRCEVTDDLFCANDGIEGGEEKIAGLMNPGEYFVVIQGASTNSGGEYGVSLTTEDVICGPTDTSCVDANTSRFCNSSGTGFEEVVCDSGCDMATGRCSRAPNDVCFTATDASAGLTETFNWSQFTNDYDPGANSCIPASGGTQADGPDVAYRVDVPPGHVMQAQLSRASGDYASLYLVEDCSDAAGTCVQGANAGTFNDEELIYFNTSSDTETLYLIADVEFDSFGYGSATLTIGVQQTTCTPNATRCTGDSVESCDRLGTGWAATLCSFGCAGGACNPVTNNSCMTPVDLDAVGSFTGRIDEYTSSYTPGFSGCTGRSASGPDAVFSTTPAAGEVATVTVDADFDAALWVTTDCSDPAANCVAGADISGQNSELVQFLGDGSTTFNVIVDSQFSGAGEFTVTGTTEMPSCTAGDVLGCKDATTLEYCTPLGVPADYACQGTCTTNQCDNPTGQACFDPVVLTDGDMASGPFDTPNTVNPGPGSVGSCNFLTGDEPDGADYIYAVDLTAGDFLFANYTATTSTAIMYLLSDCTDGNSCLMNTTDGYDGDLIYEATQDERVYLVMDRTSTFSTTLTFDLDIEVRRQDCTPGSAPFCSDATTLQYCDSLGFTHDYTCDGDCIADGCEMPTGDVCVDAIDVISGDTITGDWSTGTNGVEPLAPLDGTCSFDETTPPSGLDNVYRINLAAGDLLRAELTTTRSNAYVYILDDCDDTSTCIDSNFEPGSGTVYHLAQESGPVWVVVDSTSTATSSLSYDISFDVSASALCVPEASTCENGTAQLCDVTGQAIDGVFSCNNGCAGRGCAVDPVSDVCTTAPTATGASIYGDWDALTNDLNITSAGCTGSSGAGSEIVYAVPAAPGDVIHARLKSLGNEDVQLYVMTDCTDPEGTCQAGVAGNSDDFAELFFEPQSPGTFYLVAETTLSYSDEPFLFTYEVTSAECTTGTQLCSGVGHDLLTCNSLGVWEAYNCSGGCQNDACGTPTGRSCFDAIAMSDGSSEAGEYTNSDSLNPGSGVVGSCDFGTQSAVGADTIYTVDLSAGDILEASYTSSSSYGMLYLLTDCADATSCQANTTDGSSGDLTYVAPTDQTVYLVMDRSLSGTSTLGFTLDVSVLTPDCTPGDPATCADASTLEYCDDRGFTQSYTCGGTSGTCTNDACDDPAGGICLDAVTLTDGDSVSGDFQGVDGLNPGVGTSGACSFGSDEGSGVDHFYRVDLQDGEVLLANYTSTSSSAMIYLVSDCADGNTCLDNTDTGTSGTVGHIASGSETVYIVVDRAVAGNSTTDWTLDVSIGTPTCTPGTRSCDPNGTTLRWCNDFGLWDSFDCDGTCANDACDMPTGETCFDPQVVMDGSSIDRLYEGTNDADIGTGTVGACTISSSDDQPGTDHFYAVDLLAGETLTASFGAGPTNGSSYGFLYVTSDCFQPSACLDNTDVSASGSVTYTATTDETVYLVMDRGLSGSTTSYDYTLDVTIN